MIIDNMRLKNANPYTGLRQITSGYLPILRLPILKLIKSKKLKLSELGYYIFFLLCTDWDSDKYRKGYIRYSLRDLSTISDVPYTTLNGQLIKLIDKKLVSVEFNLLKVNDFEKFTTKIANKVSKNTLGCEELKAMFPKIVRNTEISEESDENSDVNYEISENKQINDNVSFKSSFKSEFNDDKEKKVIIKQELRTEEEYQKLSKEHGLPVDDLKWIDQNVTEELKIDQPYSEKDLINIFFDGNKSLYLKSLC